MSSPQYIDLFEQMAGFQRPDSTTTSSSIALYQDLSRAVSAKTRCWRVSQLERTTVGKPVYCNASQSTTTSVPITPTPSRPRTAPASADVHTHSPSSFLFRPRNKIIAKAKKSEESSSGKSDSRSVRVVENKYTRTQLVERMKQEVDDLILAIEEEKLSHKETKQLAAEKLRSKTVHLTQERADQLRQLNEENQSKMASLQTSFAGKMNDSARERDENIEKLRVKLVTIQSAFEAYKLNLEKEIEARFNEKVVERRKQLEVNIQHESEAIALRIANDTATVIVQREGRFLDEIKQLKKNNDRQKEEASTRAFLHGTDINKMKARESRVKDLQAEIETVETRMKNAFNDLDTAKQSTDILDKKLKLYEESLESRVQFVDDKYRSRIDELNSQINHMHLLYIEKSKKACDEQTKMDAALFERVNSAKRQLQASIDMRSRTTPSPGFNTRRRPSNVF